MSQSTAVQLSNDSDAAYRRGDYAVAEQLALQALRVDKKNADSLLILGNIFYLRRNYEKALEWYRKMQKVAPGDVSLPTLFMLCAIMRKRAVMRRKF